jgi:hypothetical protein
MMGRTYEEISHFRAPYKDSVFSGFGVYEETLHGHETHGVGEYLPVQGMGEYVPVSGFGATTEGPPIIPQPTPEVAPRAPSLFESDGGIIFSTDAGAAMINAALAPWSTKPTAFAMPAAGGDVAVVWYVGYDVPPQGSEPGPYGTFSQIASQFQKGYAVLSETSLVNPVPAKRTFIITKNPKTVASLAKQGGLYFVTRGADPAVIEAAKSVLKGGSLLAGVGPVGTAVLVVGGAAVLYMAFGGGRKKRRAA